MYCSSCGKRQDAAFSVVYNEEFISKKLYSILAFYVLQLIICLISGIGTYFDTYPNHTILDISFVVITLVFFGLNFKAILPLLKFKRVKLKLLLAFILIAILSSVAISYVVDLLNRFLFNQEYTYTYAFSNVDNKLFWMIISIGLMPAIAEELAFRGVFYNQLKTFLKPAQLVWVTSILFTTIHLSALSALWILPLALILAQLRRKYLTLWYGMAIHFAFNTTAVIIDYLQYNTPAEGISF